jgi:hypothetical protein
MAAPDTGLTGLVPPTLTSSASATFTFIGVDDGSVAGFEYRLDGGGWVPTGSPVTLTDLAKGAHTFEVRAIDNLGERDPTPASHTWTVDTQAPDTTITANPTNPSASSNASFSFTGEDFGGSGIAGFEVRLDGGAWTAGGAPHTFIGLSDGSHTVEIRAVDAAGNVDGTPASFTWTIDTTPPPAPVVVTAANGSSTNNPVPPITGTAEPGSTVTVFIDGSSHGTATADGEGNWIFTPPAPLSDGSHTVRARATDAAGNTSVDSSTNTFTVDTVEPDTAITLGPIALTNSTSASFDFTGNDGSGSGVAGFEYSLDGASFVAGTSPLSFSGLSDGEHTLRVRSVDAAGNIDTTPASYIWTVDTEVAASAIVSNDLEEDAALNATATLTIDPDATIDTAALAAGGWTNTGADTWELTSTYGAAVLTLSAKTVAFTLSNVAAQSLREGDTETVDVAIPVKDNAGNMTTADFAFTIHGAGEAPSDIALAGASVREFRANGAVVGTLSATDADSSTFTYQLTNTASGRFAVSGNKIVVANGLTWVENFTINLTNVDPEIVTGNSAANVIVGGVKNDTLSGLGGNDRLTGGAGRDKLTGGAGADDFIFTLSSQSGKTATTRDVITDFQHLIDDIDLSGIDANGSAAGNGRFSFVAAKGAAFTGVKGQLVWAQENPAGMARDKTIVMGDINGDGRADFHIELTGLKTLTAADFVL